MAEVRQSRVTFDCADPRAVAEFWKAALAMSTRPLSGGSAGGTASTLRRRRRNRARLLGVPESARRRPTAVPPARAGGQGGRDPPGTPSSRPRTGAPWTRDELAPPVHPAPAHPRTRD